MKKIVSTQGLLYGHFDAPDLSTAINERVNNKLEICYNQMSRNGDIHVSSELSYDLFDGVVTAITLSYTIDNPTPERLEYFRDICDMFYEVQGFIIDKDPSPCVFFHATDIYDMAMLIHALAYQTVCLDSIVRTVDGSYHKHLEELENEIEDEDEEDDEPYAVDEYDVVYSEDRKKLLSCRFTFNETHYEVPDGVEEIMDGAFLACRHYLELSIPRSVKVIGDYIFSDGGVIIIRDK